MKANHADFITSVSALQPQDRKRGRDILYQEWKQGRAGKILRVPFQVHVLIFRPN